MDTSISTRDRDRRRRTPRRAARRSGRFRAVRSLARRLYAWLEGSGAPPALALMLFFFLFPTDFLVLLNPLGADEYLMFTGDGAGQGVLDARRDAVEALKARSGLLVYAFVAMLCVLHRRTVARFLRTELHWVLILVLLLAGTAWSTEPSKVVTGVIQLSAGLFAALLFATTRPPGRSPYTSLYLVLIVPLALAHAAGAWIFFANGLEMSSVIEEGRRYGGLAGNPNSLGGQGVVGLWLALALALDADATRPRRIVMGLCGALFTASIVASGSGTALVAALLVAAIMLGLRLLSRVDRRYRPAWIMGAVLLALLAGGAYATQNSTGDAVDQLTGSLGKESNFTGRTALWETARAAIAARPILGWSFDAHASVTAERAYEIPFNHYHNGYLDTLVAGGFALGLLVAFNLVRFVLDYMARFRTDPRCYALVVPLFILLVLNFTEYSLLRPLSIIYQTYLCAWCLLWAGRRDADPASGAPPAARRRAAPGRVRRAFSF